MSDIKCVVCGEPWDSYGVTHGDMLSWEAVLFKAGAGCPSCTGESNGYAPATIFDVENGDEDPIERIIAAERVAEGTAPKWERPADPVHWTCDGCGVEARTDIDSGELMYEVPWKSKAHSWYSSHSFYNATPEKEPAHTFKNGNKVCEFCLTHCSECSAPLSEHLDLEMYDEGYALPSPADSHHSHVCEDCLSKVEEEEAGRVWSACYSDAERIDYMRDHSSQFEPRSFSELLACARGKVFLGYASELLS